MNIIKIKFFIDAGEARGGPPLGPVLGQYQIDIVSFCKEFNEKTSHILKGLPVPVVIKRFENRTYKLFIKNPTINFLIKQLAEDSTINFTKLYDLVLLNSKFNKYDIQTSAKIVFGSLQSRNINIKI